MKRKLLGICVAAVLGCTFLTGCNKIIWDTNYTYDKALVNFNGKTIVVEIDTWCDYEGEQIQIVTKNGIVILTSSYNCVILKTNSHEDIIGALTEKD